MKLQRFFGKLRTPKHVIVRRVVGDSMSPTLLPGRIVIGVRSRKLQIGDMIIVQHEGLEKVKRVHLVQEGQVYLLGDNLGASIDSRTFGWLDASTVLARIIWPR